MNFSQLSNSFAQSYINQNLNNDPRWVAVRNYIAQATGGHFIEGRANAFVGSDPNVPESSWMLIVLPTFNNWDLGSPSHQAGSVIAYVSEGRTAVTGSIAEIDHATFTIGNMTLAELDTKGTVSGTTVSRDQINSMGVDELALFLTQASSAQYDPTLFTTIRTKTAAPDLAAITQIVMEGFTTDEHAGYLYPPGGLQSILNDGGTAGIFSQAAALKKAKDNDALAIVVCTSTSCNGCSSCSSTIEIGLDIFSAA